MTTDQAAGLRRRRRAQPGYCLSCFFDSPPAVVRLAQAFHDRGLSVLLVDVLGRQFAAASPRSLFDWPHQLARRQLSTLPQAYGEGWFAPGLRLDAPGLDAVLALYDCVILDAGPLGEEVSFPQQARHASICAIERDQSSMQLAYRLLKTLSQMDNTPTAYVLGDAENCATVLAACRCFLSRDFIERVNHGMGEQGVSELLAGRMAHEEGSRKVRSE